MLYVYVSQDFSRIEVSGSESFVFMPSVKRLRDSRGTEPYLCRTA